MPVKNRKGMTTTEAHIQAFNTMLSEEKNPKFKNKVEKHRRMLVLEPFHAKPTIVANMNELINSGRKIKKEREHLQEKCNNGNALACEELPKMIECVHCDDIEPFLIDLAQDKAYAQVFDEAIPRKKQTRTGENRQYPVSPNVINPIMESNTKKYQQKQAMIIELAQSDDPIVRQLAQKLGVGIINEQQEHPPQEPEIFDTRIGRFKAVPVMAKKQLVDVEVEAMGLWIDLGQMKHKDFNKLIQRNIVKK